jgi:nitrite reductase/ring-hydroxylating ferredoxin subunit
MYISYETNGLSFRTQDIDGQQYILIGGEAHRTGENEDTQQCYNNLFNAAKAIYGDNFELHYKWSAQDMITLDGIPYIGQYGSKTEGLYVATGFKKWGMTNGTAAAMIISDDILKKENNYKQIFSAQRFDLAPSLVELGGNVMEATKKLITARLDNTGKTIDNLEKGEGGTITYNGEKVGAYKDSEGKVYLVDIVCPHLGCELQFNIAEKSWDCPCHGSRFTITGEIIEAPTTEKLKLIKL